MAQITVDVANALPENFVPDKVVVIIEGIDGDDDETTMWWTTSPGLKTWQSLGMLEAAIAVDKAGLIESFKGTEPEPDDD